MKAFAKERIAPEPLELHVEPPDKRMEPLLAIQLHEACALPWLNRLPEKPQLIVQAKLPEDVVAGLFAKKLVTASGEASKIRMIIEAIGTATLFLFMQVTKSPP